MTQNAVSKKEKLRILIADDVHETRRNTRLMIATMDNVEVTAIASNGVQAVEMTKEYHPDIVILDINMPAMDGLTAYKHIIEEYPGTGCIIISAENDPTTVKAATSMGIQEYLVKPFTTEELEAAIKRVTILMWETRQKIAKSHHENLNNIAYLKQLANQYLKEGRTDDEATQIFERLAEDPQCDVRWLESLAMMYAVRWEWGKLKSLAARLEQKINNGK
ncbi:MAG: response regulator transcription factor [Anaerolineales bacterium]|jgi:YesN/AraC family two-component response regulator|nr:response regulator transcription factor [Anaerolineales bacterium]